MEQQMKIDKMYTMIEQMAGTVYELKTDMNELKADVSVLKTDVNELKADVNELKADVSSLNSEMAGVKQRLVSLELIYENELRRNINLIAEGHSFLVHKLDETIARSHDDVIYKLRVERLETEVSNIKMQMMN